MGVERKMGVEEYDYISGTYHLSGCPPQACQPIMRPVLTAAGQATIICWLPLPRYVIKPCCNDQLHMHNWAEADFGDILLSGSVACTNVLRTEGEKHGLTIATFNPLNCFGQVEDLTEVKSSAGLSIWREDDAVHLTAASYGDIAAVLANQAEANSPWWGKQGGGWLVSSLSQGATE